MATKADIDRWIAAQGGPDAVAYSYDDVEVPDPRGMRTLPDGSENEEYDRAFKDKKITVRRETWRNKTTGAAYSGTRTPFADDQFQDIKEESGTRPTTAANAKPAIPVGGKSETEGTPLPGGGWDNSRPRQVIKDAQGNVVWSEELTGADLTAWRNNQQASQPQTGEVKKPVEGRPGWTSVTRGVVQGGNKTEETVYIGPDGKETRTLPPEAGKPTQAADGSWGYWDTSGPTPTWTPIANGPAGKKYTEIKQDPATGGWQGLTADGKWEPIQGGPGTGAPRGSAGPTMPQIVLGHSQDALRQYKADLQQGVGEGRWSQKWADDRWGEAIQIANTAVQEAATRQRELESTRNAEINIAQGRATYGQNAMTTALDHVNKINGKLSSGSSLGGQTFAAILGLSMLQEARSGLSSVDPRGRQPLPTVTPSTMNNKDAVASTHAAVSSQVAEAARPSAASPAPSSQPSAAAVAARPATATSSTAAAAAPPSQAASAPGRTTKAMVRVDLGDEYVYYTPTPDLLNAPNVAVVDVPNDRQDGHHESKPATATAPGAPPMKQDVPSDASGPSVNTDGTPDYGQPGMRVLPQPPSSASYYPLADESGPPPSENQMPVDVPYPTNDASISQAPAQWPVLAQYSPPASGVQAMPNQPADAQPSWGVLAQYGPASVGQPQQAQPTAAYPAAMQSRAKVTEPWRLSAAEIQQMLDSGVSPDDIWGVPGRVA